MRTLAEHKVLLASLAIIIISSLFLPYVPTVDALPSSGQMAGGAATIQQPTAQSLRIDQMSDRALLHWQGFSIGQGESVQFVQPSTTSLAVNRVLGGDPSLILGSLIANGRVFLLNPNGVLFGPNATVNVGGLLASTLSLKSYDLMTGRFELAQDPTKALAAVVNQGTLRVADHGFLVLAAPGVVNDGLIVAKFGQVGLAAGTQLAVDFRGDGLIQYAVDGKVLGQVTDPKGQPLSAAVNNAGRIEADGGTVLLTAQASSAVVSSVINQTGVIQARRLEGQGGEIVLRGGDEGAVMVAGSLDATGEQQALGTGQWALGGKGGSIDVRGQQVGLTETARLDVSGENGGGTIHVGGGFQGKDGGPNAQQTVIWPGAMLVADAGTQGDGGTVVVWADGATQFGGMISARGGPLSGNGGFAEVSGKESLVFRGTVDLRAPLGQRGTLLLDPKFIVISSAVGTAAYTPPYGFGDNASSTVTILDTGVGSLSAAINAANVTLQANTDISFASSANVTATTFGSGLTVQAGRSISMGNNSQITLNGGDFLAKINDEGAVPAERDGGMAQFTMNGGAQLLTNGGDLTITVGTFTPGQQDGEIRIGNGSGSATLSSGAGFMDIVGFGAPGIVVDGGSIIQSTTGGIALVGSSQSASGVRISDVGTQVTSMNGSIAIQGIGSGNAGTTGLELRDGAAVTSTGTASIEIFGKGNGASAQGISTFSTVAQDNLIGGPSATGNITIFADFIALARVLIQSSGELWLSPAGSGTVGLAGGTGSFNLSTAELDLFQPGFNHIFIGGAGNNELPFTYHIGTSAGPTGYTFQDSVTIHHATGFGKGNISVDGPLATTGSKSLTVEAGTTVTVSSTGSLTTVNGALTLMAGDDLALNGAADSIRGSGTLTLEPLQPTTSIGLGDGFAGFNLDSTELLTLKDGFSSITIGKNIGQHSIVIAGTGVTFRDPVTIRTPLGGSITVGGTLTGTGNASITLIGSGATTILNADIVTDGQPIVIDDSVIVSGGADTTRTLDTTNEGTNVTGANITVTGTINAQTTAPDNESLTANGGTTGDLSLQSEIGGTKPLENLTTDGNDTSFPQTTLTGSLEASGTGTGSFHGEVVIGNDGTIHMVYPAGMNLFADMISPNAELTAVGPITIWNNLMLDVGIGTLIIQNAVNTQTFNLTLRGNGIDLLGGPGTVTGAGTNVLELAPGTSSTALEIAVADGLGTLKLSAADLDTLSMGANGFQTVRLGRADSTAAITVGSYTAQFPFTLESNAGGTGTIAVTGALATSTTGDGLTLIAGKSIVLSSGSSIMTNNGPLTLKANEAGTATGNFVGIDLNGATLTAGSGPLTLLGKGGTTGNDNMGIRLTNNTQVGGGSGLLTMTGVGGNGGTGQQNVGVSLQGGSQVTTTTGGIQVAGTGGTNALGPGNVPTGQFNRGVQLITGAQVLSTGSGPITMLGQGGASGTIDHGLAINSRIASAGGAIDLTGLAGGTPTGMNNHGLILANGAQVEGTGPASIHLKGTGGQGIASDSVHGEAGVYIIGTNGTFVRTQAGALTVEGTGGGTSFGGYGVIVRFGAVVESTGGGAVLLKGTGSPTGTAFNHGVIVYEAGTTIRATGTAALTLAPGQGGGTWYNNYGVMVGNGALVEHLGTGTLTITGTGGGNGDNEPSNFGVLLLGATTQIKALQGEIVITGTGAGTPPAQGVFQVNSPVIQDQNTPTIISNP